MICYYHIRYTLLREKKQARDIEWCTSIYIHGLCFTPSVTVIRS